jgi:hypothetical protein
MPRFYKQNFMRRSAHSPTGTTLNRIDQFLLRRTAAALAAALGIVAIADAQAQSAVRLNSGSTSAECTYATMSVAPNGTVTVSCSGTIATNAGGTTTPPPTNNPPAATSFTLSSAGGSLTAGSSPSPALQIVRNGDTAGAYIVGYNVDGDACVNKGNYSVSFADGNATPKDVTQVQMATSGSRCTVTLGYSRLPAGTYAVVNGTPNSASYTLGTTNTNNPPPASPDGCPATPSNMQAETWQPIGQHNYWMTPMNGTIVSVALPTSGLPTIMPSFAWTPSARSYSPDSGFVRYSVTKCPGQILDSQPMSACNGREGVTYFSRQWITTNNHTYYTQARSELLGICWAPAQEGQWYLNFRYESFQGTKDGQAYTGCPYNVSTCGVLWQLNQ